MLKKIRIQRVSIFDIVATLVLAVVLVAFAVQGTGELAQMQTATDDYIQCETLARQLQSGSDYLIEQVRMYTATGQREYMDNYFEELNTTRRRENALEYFAEHYGDTDAFTLLKSAMTTSQNLSSIRIGMPCGLWRRPRWRTSRAGRRKSGLSRCMTVT